MRCWAEDDAALTGTLSALVQVWVEASLLLEVLRLASPVFTQVVVDRVLVHQNVNMLNVMLVGMLFLYLIERTQQLDGAFFNPANKARITSSFSSPV